MDLYLTTESIIFLNYIAANGTRENCLELIKRNIIELSVALIDEN